MNVWDTGFILHITEKVEDKFLMMVSILYENTILQSHNITKEPGALLH